MNSTFWISELNGSDCVEDKRRTTVTRDQSTSTGGTPAAAQLDVPTREQWRGPAQVASSSALLRGAADVPARE
jgi:hypothetical protein